MAAAVIHTVLQHDEACAIRGSIDERNDDNAFLDDAIINSMEMPGLPGHIPMKLTRSDSIAPKPFGEDDDIVRTGVKEGIYTKWIESELTKEEYCLELPLTILLLISFSVMALYHIHQPTISVMEEAIITDIVDNANFAWAHHFGHKGIHDVNSYADFWSWTRLGLIPLLAMPWAYSEELGAAVPHLDGRPAYNVSDLPPHREFPGHLKLVPVRNDYIRYNRLIGGFRFSQEVAGAESDVCTFPGQRDVTQLWYGKPCTGKTAHEMFPDVMAAETMAQRSRVEWFMSDVEDYNTLIMRVLDMEDGCTSAVAQNRTCLCIHCAGTMNPWLDELTYRLEVAFLVYNAQYGVYSLAQCNFWFNRAGYIHKIINVRSSWAGVILRETSHLVIMVIADIVWVLLCFYVVMSEARQIISMVRSKKQAWYITVIDDYLGFWNAVDWVSILIAGIILAWFVELWRTTDGVNGALADYARSSGSADRVEALALTQAFYTKAEVMYSAEWQFRFTLGIYPLVLMLRFFKSFAAQPRLAVVTETFRVAQTDLIHFFIVFGSVYFCMTVNAILFFGQDLPGFATFGRAFHSSFRIMLGDWDWEELSQIGLLKAFIWFFVFIFVVVMILLNMLLAIFMESYIAVSDSAQSAQSLFRQCREIYRRNKQNRMGERVRLNDILAAFQQEACGDSEAVFASERVIYPSDAMALVPGLTHQQARRTLRSALYEYNRVRGPSFSFTLLQELLESMKQRGDESLMCGAWLRDKFDTYGKRDEEERPKRSSEKEASLSAVDQRETGDERGPPKLHTDLFGGLEAVKYLAQSQAEELTSGATVVMSEEMGRMWRRQKELMGSMQQMQAVMQGLRSQVYTLHRTATNFSRSTPSATSAPVVQDARMLSVISAAHPFSRNGGDAKSSFHR